MGNELARDQIPYEIKTDKELLVLVASHCNAMRDDIAEIKIEMKALNGTVKETVQSTYDNLGRIKAIEQKLTFNWKTGSFLAIIIAMVIMEIRNLIHWG